MTNVINPAHNAPAAQRPAITVGGDVPHISESEAARTIVGDGTTATLATIALSPAGYPYGSIVSYAVDEDANPLLFISELAEHTRNLRADGRASLLIAEPAPPDADPLALGRVTLVGTASPVDPDEVDAVRETIVDRHPAVAGYAGYGDFAPWRLRVSTLRWVGGFGRMDWIDAAAYAAAEVDVVHAARHGVIEHMNADHADAGVLMCQRAIAGAGHGDVVVTAAVLDSVDRYGCDYVATTSAGPASVRLAFDEPVRSLGDVRAAVVTLVRRARVS